MRLPPRFSNAFLLGTYLLLSAVPFLSYSLGKPLIDPAELAGIEIIVWLFVWSVFKRPARFHWLLLPAFVAIPVELYLYRYYGQGISSHHLGILFETSPREAVEFLGSKIWILLLVSIAMLGWFGLSWRVAHRTSDLDWSGKVRWLVVAIFSTATAAWMYGHEFGVARSASVSPRASARLINQPTSTATSTPPWFRNPLAPSPLPQLASWAALPVDTARFGHSWPFGLVVGAREFWAERAYLGELKLKSNAFRFGASQGQHQSTGQVVVMVIGESSRFDRWSLNGYDRETNPLLKGEQNLVSLSNVITGVSATRLSVPVLVSRKPATQSLKAGFSEKSFLSAYREAGFKTYWLSNQMAFGKFDTPVSVYADEADVTRFMNLGGVGNASSHDDVLFDALSNALADPAANKLIVLHTLGNHWNYSHRHPKEFDKWQPSLFGVVNPAYTDLKMKPQINNSYDNSILYTDWFLSQVIGSLKSTGQLASMVYVSDHGQSLYDGSCTYAFHGHNTQYDFHVPALVWYSEKYQVTYPEKVAQLLRHQRARLSTENIFHSLLDMADIRYDTEALEWSFLSKQFRPHKRYVDSYGWTDYDNATFKGDCREVIDNGKPLLQEK